MGSAVLNAPRLVADLHFASMDAIQIVAPPKEAETFWSGNSRLIRSLVPGHDPYHGYLIQTLLGYDAEGRECTEVLDLSIVHISPPRPLWVNAWARERPEAHLWAGSPPGSGGGSPEPPKGP